MKKIDSLLCDVVYRIMILPNVYSLTFGTWEYIILNDKGDFVGVIKDLEMRRFLGISGWPNVVTRVLEKGT
jgi:hypothetical protein